MRNTGNAPVRPTVAVVSLLAITLGACEISTSTPPRLGYAPPDAAPADPGLGYVAQPTGLIWNQLLDRLIQAQLQVDLADPKRGIVVARYSGDPEPYVTCGWIVLDRGGEPEQVPASGIASFNRVIDGRRLAVNRDMKLDARLVVQVKADGDGAAVETSSNYVLTKTVEAEGGWSRSRAREVVSFSDGERGEFSKGTVCQPNGALERTVLDILPGAGEGAGEVALDSEEPATVGRGAAGASGGAAPISPVEAAGSLPALPGSEPGPMAALAEDSPGMPPAERSEGAAATGPSEDAAPGPARQAPDASDPPPVREAALTEPAVPSLEGAGASNGRDEEQLLECPVDDRIFCEVLDLTDPYRRANLERDLGLAVDTVEGENALFSDSALGLDISLPNYEAYLTVSYFLTDGTVRHVVSGSSRRWPANAREFVSDAGLSTDERRNIEMVVALASDVPLFPWPRPAAEGAERYLSELRERLAEMSNGGAPAEIAATLLVVTPA